MTIERLAVVEPGDDLSQERTSLGLSARSARVALRVADLVEATCTPQASSPTVSFLRSWGDHALHGDDRRTDPTTLSPSPFQLLAARYGFDALASDLVLLAALPEEHEGLAATFRSMHPHGDPRPTLGIAALLADADADEGGRMRVRQLCEPGGVIGEGLVRLSGGGPLFERSIELAPGLWGALHGDDAWPADLGRVRIDAAPPGLDGWLRLPAVLRATAALSSAMAVTLVVSSDDQAVALSRCAAMAQAARKHLLAAHVGPDDVYAARLLVTHAAVRDAIPVFCVGTPGGEGPTSPPDLDLTWLPGPALVTARSGAVRPVGRRPVLDVPLGPIGGDDHRRAWSQNVPHLRAAAPILAARHPLDPALTAVVAADLRSQRQLGGQTGLEDVSAAIRSRSSINLPTGVSLSVPGVTWDRLVLPPEPAQQLQDAVSRLDHQRLVLEDWGFADEARADRGVRLLFTGPPGTGKSLAAAAVASAARTDLLVVDVARLVSKWVGETEKNLAGAFDAAERTQAVLLLDEADVLFGTRTQIKDANDRYANLETAYLLQRMDTFEGLVVLTSNLRQNIDAAFLRRVDFLVEFGLPDERHRKRLWQLHLPDRVSMAEDVDLCALARMYPVPGAWIRNAAIGAAFLAAPRGGPITREHLLRAMRREYAKSARPYPGDPPTGQGEETP